jgi:hypothetical protein
MLQQSRALSRQSPQHGVRASPAVVARPLVFLVVIAGGLGRVANQLAAGPCNEPTGRALPRAKALQHVLSDAGVTKSDEERCIVGAAMRLTALVAGRGRFPSHAPNEIHEGVVAHGFSFHFGFRSSTSQICCSRLLRVRSLFTSVSAKAVIS